MANPHNDAPADRVAPLDKAVADKLFAPPPAEDGTDPGVDEFDAAQMSGSWFTPEKDSNLGGPRVRYAPGAPPPVIATVRRTPGPDDSPTPQEGRQSPADERTNPWLVTGGLVLMVLLLAFFVFLLGSRTTQ